MPDLIPGGYNQNAHRISLHQWVSIPHKNSLYYTRFLVQRESEAGKKRGAETKKSVQEPIS